MPGAIAELGAGLLLAAAGIAGAAPAQPQTAAGYVARADNLASFFTALSASLKTPVIVSPLAARKQISGEFDLRQPRQVLQTVSEQLGLVWYHDGQTIHVYDASEMHSALLSLEYASVRQLIERLRRSGLYDHRYPLRGDLDGRQFYLSAPPLYVDLVTQAAAAVDRPVAAVDTGGQEIGVIRLSNAFVGDRSYVMREQTVNIPGLATLLQRMLASTPAGAAAPAPPPAPPGADRGRNPEPAPPAAEPRGRNPGPEPAVILADPDHNSLLVRSTPAQLRIIRSLVQALDQPKPHIELSLWIIDMHTSDLDQLGVSWNGGARFGSVDATINANSPTATLDGSRFVASIKALEQNQQANIVSRPIVLTQENVPALFDNNRTFYAKLIGERAVQLEHVTYGTLVRVLPRFAADGQIEMELTIEDGSLSAANTAAGSGGDALPEVGRTHISTVARVPQGKSLLIGGYTQDQNDAGKQALPGLSRLPLLGGLFRDRHLSRQNSVRVFLIEPRAIVEPLPRDASDLAAAATAAAAPPSQRELRARIDHAPMSGARSSDGD